MKSSFKQNGISAKSREIVLYELIYAENLNVYRPDAPVVFAIEIFKCFLIDIQIEFVLS